MRAAVVGRGVGTQEEQRAEGRQLPGTSGCLGRPATLSLPTPFCPRSARASSPSFRTPISVSDFILVRVGATVTDPPDIVHKDGYVDGKEISWPVEPAACAAAPFSTTDPKLFVEDALMAVAYSDQVDCFVHCAVRAPVRAGCRHIACVAPRLYAKDSVPDLIKSWYGEEVAKRCDTSYYDDPAHRHHPVYDLGPAKALGWEPKVDLLASKGL